MRGLDPVSFDLREVSTIWPARLICEEIMPQQSHTSLVASGRLVGPEEMMTVERRVEVYGSIAGRCWAYVSTLRTISSARCVAMPSPNGVSFVSQ